MKNAENTILMDADLVERDISRLQERRQEISRNLEAFRLALENLLGKSPDFVEDIEPFLKIHKNLAWDAGSNAGKLKAQEMAFRIWLSRQKAPFNVLPEKAADALGFVPPEVEEVVTTWTKYDDTRSEEPARYWSATKQKFRLLGVSESEKENIAGRNTMTFYSDENREAFQTVSEQCNLINFLNKTANVKRAITPGVLNMDFPLLGRVLLVKKDHRNAPIIPNQYRPDYKIFGSFPDWQDCFDE